MTKTMIAMSGGVDSSVAALLTMQRGDVCMGATMLLCGADGTPDARRVCQTLGIPFYAFDNRKAFRREVMDGFVDAYEQGDTPNPCFRCNQRIKFGILLEQALAIGCDKIGRASCRERV